MLDCERSFDYEGSRTQQEDRRVWAQLIWRSHGAHGAKNRIVAQVCSEVGSRSRGSVDSSFMSDSTALRTMRRAHRIILCRAIVVGSIGEHLFACGGVEERHPSVCKVQ